MTSFQDSAGTRGRMIAAVLIAGLSLFTAARAHAGPTAEESCQSGRYGASTKYAACIDKVLGAYLGSPAPLLDRIDRLESSLSKCSVKYRGAWAKLQAKAAGSGATCDQARFGVGGDGTVTDRLTGLQWEQKTDDGSVHDKDNTYNLTAGGPSGTTSDGDAYSSFFTILNGACFAGDCDWRLPTLAEILTILDGPLGGCATPCIDQSAFGPTAAFYYWSATTNASDPSHGWSLGFHVSGYVLDESRNLHDAARAVRGGL